MPISGIYWTHYTSGQLMNIDSDFDVVSVVASGMTLPKGIYANDTDEKFYIVADDRVYRCDYSGSGLETIIVDSDLPAPYASISLQDIVVDESGAKLYFNDSYYGRVYRANLDGSSLETIYDASVDAAYGGYLGMAIDPVNEYIYWCVTRPAGHPGAEARNIERIDYDGSNFTIIAQRNHLDFPFTDLFLDVSGQIMYWTNLTENVIEASGLDSGSSTVIGSSTDPYFLDFDIERQKVYWYDNTDDLLYYDDIGSGFRVTITSGLNAGGILFASSSYPSEPSETLNLFIKGPELVTTSSGDGNLFINGIITQEPSQGTEMRIIHRLVKTGTYNPQLIGSFNAPAVSANIEVWDIVDGQNTVVSIANSGCYAVGDTGKFGWSTEYLPFTGGDKKYHYYFRMTSNTNEEVYGEFFITVPERGRWSYPD